VRVIREALLDLIISAAGAALLYVAEQELVRRPSVDAALLAGLVPVTARKSPWLAVIVGVLLLLWLWVRAIGGPRGTLWGASRWLVRLGLWWSAAALLLFVGVAAHGAFTRDAADFNWPFALGFLAVAVPIGLACGVAWRRTSPVAPDSG
jgi:hypothetical protein